MNHKPDIITILVSTVISGVFTFFTALLIDHYTTKQKRLQYDTQRSIPFQKDSLSLCIYNLELLNDGDELVDDIKGHIRFPGQQIAGYRFSGSPVLTMKDSIQQDRYQLFIGSLNPAEQVDVSFLITGTDPAENTPQVAFRAKGLTAIEKKDGGKRSYSSPLHKVLPAAIIVAIVLTYLLIMPIRKWWRKKAQYPTQTVEP